MRTSTMWSASTVAAFSLCTRVIAQLPTTMPAVQSSADLEGYRSAKITAFSNVQLADFLSLRTASESQSPSSQPAIDEINQLARQSLGQPYRLRARRFDQSETDCVVFVERTLALALATDWTSYRVLCDRLRHKDGVVDYRQRNFFTLQDWVPNNAWIFRDVTRDLAQAGGFEARSFTVVFPPKRFVRISTGRTVFAGADFDSPDQTSSTDYMLGRESLSRFAGLLKSGDVCLVIKEFTKPNTPVSYDCDHMGLIVMRSDRSPIFVHAAPPKVRGETLTQFLGAFPTVAGIKILRLKDDSRNLAAQEVSSLVSTIVIPAPAEQDSKMAAYRTSP